MFAAGNAGNLTYTPGAGITGSTSTLYGSGYLLQANPNLLCPAYDQQYYIDAKGVAYYIYCGYGGTAANAANGAVQGGNAPGMHVSIGRLCNMLTLL